MKTLNAALCMLKNMLSMEPEATIKKKLYVNVAVPRLLANDNADNEAKPCIYFTAEENPGKRQLGDL